MPLPRLLISVSSLALLVAFSGRAAAYNPPPPPAHVNTPRTQPPFGKAPFDASTARTLQETWAKHLGLPVESKSSLGQRLILIPPGEFLMGSTDAQVASALKWADTLRIDDNTRRRIRDTERPVRPVQIPHPFLMGTTEVTIGQFRTFVTATKYVTEAELYGNANASQIEPAPPHDKNGLDWRNPGFAQIEEDAVSQISWNDAVVFCNWLSEREHLTPSYVRQEDQSWKRQPRANGYRFPTEAEWEYACRAGTTTHYSFGDDPTQLEKFAWFALKSGSRPVRRVGSLPANPFGLHEMHGNLCEWCEDFFLPPPGQTTALKTSPRNPNRVLRGGDWYGNALRCRSAFRGYGAQSTRSDDVGFRLVRSLQP